MTADDDDRHALETYLVFWTGDGSWRVWVDVEGVFRARNNDGVLIWGTDRDDAFERWREQFFKPAPRQHGD